ncbi:MAG: hypothetical protein ABIP46_05135 [Polaromonas sp.]
MKSIKNILVCALAAALAAGCAFPSLQPGMSREQVIASYGTPSRVVPLGAGTRLQYSRQPGGQSAIMVDLDAAGKVVSAREALTLANFSRVALGQWTREDVEREFGRPATVDRVASWPGDVMTYRWLDADQDMFFWIYLDAANVAQRTAQGIEFRVKMNDG